MQAATRYFRKACDLGKKEAYRYLGDAFYYGYGVECCFRTAADIYKQGVARGDAGSKFRVGMCYEFGHGTDLQFDVAMKLFSDAADEGSGESIGVQQDLTKSFQLLREAFDAGSIQCIADLAHCYNSGRGVMKNPEE